MPSFGATLHNYLVTTSSLLALVHNESTSPSASSPNSSLIESKSEKPSKKRRRVSKYVRRSDETDVIHILEAAEDDTAKSSSLSSSVEKNVEADLEKKASLKDLPEIGNQDVDDNSNSFTGNGLCLNKGLVHGNKAEEVNPTQEMETECDSAQDPSNTTTSNLISTRQMFKPKKKNAASKRKAEEVHQEDEDTVDLDFVNVKSCKRIKDESKILDATIKSKEDASSAAAVATASSSIAIASRENNTELESSTLASFTNTATPASANAISSKKQQKKNCNAKVDVEDTQTPVVKVNLFKNKQPKKRSRRSSAAKQKSLYQNGSNKDASATKSSAIIKELHSPSYDSDSIDIDVLATFSARTFAQSTGISPPTESSNLDDNAFTALLRKPLTKTTPKKVDDDDSDEKEGDQSKENDDPIQNGTSINEALETNANSTQPREKQASEILIPSTEGEENKNKLPSHKGDNAFSRLMAPKGRRAKQNAVSQNDIVPKAINVVNKETTTTTSEAPASKTTTLATSFSEVATPKSTTTTDITANRTSTKITSSSNMAFSNTKRRKTSRRKRIVELEDDYEENQDDLLNSSANDFVDAPPDVRSKKEAINVVTTEGEMKRDFS